MYFNRVTKCNLNNLDHSHWSIFFLESWLLRKASKQGIWDEFINSSAYGRIDRIRLSKTTSPVFPLC